MARTKKYEYNTEQERKEIYAKNRKEKYDNLSEYDKAELEEKRRERYLRDKEKDNALSKKWKQEHKKECYEYGKKYREEHRKELNETARARYAWNKIIGKK